MMKLGTGVVLALAAGAATLTAQQQHQGGSGMRRGQMGSHMGSQMDPGMHMMAFSPARLLDRKADLKLTPEQVTQIEKIAADAKAKHDQATASQQKHMQEMMEAMESTKPDAQLVHTHFMGALEAMGAAHWAEIEAGLAAMALLTDEQRVMVKGWMGHDMGMGQGMEQGMGQGMQGCCQGMNKKKN
jgi:hypothetical protein